jgi:3-hydroxybutyryl-CoA dehydrogenase
VPKKIESIAVLGTGTLGAQIALMAVYAGNKVSVYDPRPDALEATLTDFSNDMQAKKVSPFIPYDEWDGLRDQIIQCQDLGQAVKQADLIIEVIPERLEMKQELFAQLATLAPPEAILGSNSSSMPVSKFASHSTRPQQCLNLHFYMPLQGANIVDVMGCDETLPEVFDAGIQWVRSLNCLPLRVNKEVLGFCMNRVWRAIKKEVLWMWGNDIADFRDIDRGYMKILGHEKKYGPFGLMDRVGLDVVWDIEMVYYNESKDPADHPPQKLKDKIEAGELGVKTGKGFYSYPDPEYLQEEFFKP